MLLFDYQKKVIEYCKNDESHSQLISMPTGTGKTITFLHLAKEYNKKTLIIVHREELLNQTHDKALLCGFIKDEISIISSNSKEKLKKLNIAMVQTLNRNLNLYNPEDIELIIIDEAHHATAQSYRNILKYFQVFECKKYLFGFTATPLRGDKDQLSDLFFSHSFKMTLSEATKLGYIVPVSGIRISIDKSLKDIDQVSGDYDIKMLDKVMNCDSINDLIVSKCINLPKMPAIVFCTSVDHAETLANKLRQAKRKAISISYKTSKKSIERILKFLKNGKIEFITNAVKLSEGFDHPPIQSVILARPTRSPVLYKQMIGRGLRNHPNKYDCFVLEFTSNDPKMIILEDIDENATFQTYSSDNQLNEKEARNKYKTLFNSPNIEILDVRVSPFIFYECKIRRYIKYRKQYIYIPFEEGFSFYSFKTDARFKDLFYMYGSMFFWKEKYKSFYMWSEGNFLMNPGAPQQMKYLLDVIKNYTKLNKLGKWYPSELQKPDRKQKELMKNLGINCMKFSSTRKAEMEIEEMAINKAIDKYMSKNLFSGIMNII